MSGLRRWWRAAIFAPLLVSAFSGCGGCSSCGSSDAIAKLVEATGTVQRDDEPAPVSFKNVEVGQDFMMGDAIHTTASPSSATIEFTGGAGSVKLRAMTTVRFGKRKNGQGSSVQLETGEVLIEAGPQGMEFQTLRGLATLAPNGRARITRRAGPQTVDIEFGAATIEQANGQPLQLGQGQRLVVEIGGDVRIESISGDGPRREVPTEPDAGVAAVVVEVDAGMAMVEVSPPPVPTGGTFQVDVQRHAAQVRGPNDTDFRDLPVGTGEVQAGSRLVVPAGGTVVVIGADGQATIVGAADVIVGQNGALVDVNTARRVTSVAADGRDMVVQFPSGRLVLRGSDGESAGEITPTAAETRITQRQGSADVRGPDGVQRIRRGQTVVVARPESGDTGVQCVPGPGRGDFGITGGESATIHNPRGATNVRVRVAGCGGGGIVEVARGTTFRGATAYCANEGSAVVPISSSAKYRVRCGSAGNYDATPVASGNLRLSRDAGTQQYPVRPPRSTVDADGRSWRVTYQTLLPTLTFQWPNAPASGGGYVFRAQGNGAPPERRNGAANVTFDSGAFDEGTYTFSWATADGSRRSNPTRLVIEFDNATPTAFIRTPAAGAAVSGSVRVSGAALEGATVSAGGRNLSLDGQRRFSGDVSVPAEDACLAIRIAHPQRGVHYYLRCGGGG